jgi:predicted hydrocarbon binding protein
MPPISSNPGRSLAVAELFRFRADEGSRRRPDGTRVLAISEPLVDGLHRALIDTLGETAQDALYRIGYEWALQAMLNVHRDLRDEAAGAPFDLWQLNARPVLDQWWATLENSGWGTLTLDLATQSRGVTFVELRHSIVAAALRGSDQPVCHLYAGLFAGALSFFDRAERHSAEVQCAAMGGEVCKFIIGPGAEVDSAEAWRQQNVPADEIIRRLR